MSFDVADNIDAVETKPKSSQFAIKLSAMLANLTWRSAPSIGPMILNLWKRVKNQCEGDRKINLTQIICSFVQ